MSENKFHPYTEEQYIELKQKIEPIKDWLPENLLPYIWDNYKLLSGSTENRPCSCGSAAKHWIKAVNVIKDFISKVENA